MDNPKEPRAFDWDNDYDELVQERRLRVLTDDGRSVTPTHTSDSSDNVRPVLARWAAPIFVCAALGGAYILVGASGFGGQPAAQSAAIFGIAPQQTGTMPLPALQAYSEQQARSFLSGLSRFSDADLRRYADTTRRDLAYAGTLLAPFMRDALSLTEYELARQASAVAPAFGGLQDIRVDP